MDIITIAEELITLRKQTECLDMQKASLFAQVQEDKSYKEQFGTFDAFCQYCGYHRQTVYALLRCFRNDTVRVAYSDIGALSAQTIAKADKVLAPEKVSELVKLARTEKSPVVLRRVAKAKEEANSEQSSNSDSDSDSTTLPSLLSEKSRLLNRKSDLEHELAIINNRLVDLETQIAELAD